jgi:hypothetical protein
MKPMSIPKEVKWKFYDNRKNAIARVGIMTLVCWGYRLKSTWNWKCEVTINGLHKSRRYGTLRRSMAKSKQEAEKIAQEFVMDTREGLKETMRLFGLEED